MTRRGDDAAARQDHRPIVQGTLRHEQVADEAGGDLAVDLFAGIRVGVKRRLAQLANRLHAHLPQRPLGIELGLEGGVDAQEAQSLAIDREIAGVTVALIVASGASGATMRMLSGRMPIVRSRPFVLPPRSSGTTATGRKFICVEPTNPATNRLAGEL